MNKVLTLKETAALLGINYVQTTKLAAAKKIPAFKVGRLWRVYWEDLLKYMREQYNNNASQSVDSTKGSNEPWHFAKEVIPGGLDFVSKEKEYKSLLGLQTK